MANAVQGTTNFDIDVALLDTRSNYSWITPVTTYHWSSSSEPMPQIIEVDQEFFWLQTRPINFDCGGLYRVVTCADEFTSRLVNVREEPIEQAVNSSAYSVSRLFKTDDERVCFWERATDRYTETAELTCLNCRRPVSQLDWTEASKWPTISLAPPCADLDVHVMLYHEVKYHTCSEIILGNQCFSADFLRSAWRIY